MLIPKCHSKEERKGDDLGRKERGKRIEGSCDLIEVGFKIVRKSGNKRFIEFWTGLAAL